MMKMFPFVLMALSLTHWLAIEAVSQKGDSSKNWHHWRGPNSNGVSPTAQPPIEWSETKNVRWKTDLPGRGHSTPIVWENQVFVTAAEPVGEKFKPRYSGRPGAHDNLPVSQKHQFLVLALDRKTGKMLWKKKVNELVPREGAHISASLASASCTTDGKALIAHFGSFGTYALDFQGNILWKKQLGEMHSKHGHGEGASPVMLGDRLFIVWDHEGQSFVACFAIKDGKELWRKKRNEVTSWSSPIVIQPENGKPQLVVNGTERIRAYDTQDGTVIWECAGLSANIVASPVFKSGVVVAGSSYEKRAILGIQIDGAKGDVTGSKNVLWKSQRLTPYVPSLLLYEEAVYYLRHYQGIVSRIDFKKGEELSPPVRLTGFREIYASPVAADGRIYITDREGTTVVLSSKDWPRVLSANQIEGRVNGSLALAGKQIFLRSEKALYCIEQQ